MHRDLLAVLLAIAVATAAALVIDRALCDSPRRAALIRFLDEHAPMIGKEKNHVVLLYPSPLFSELIVGLDLAGRRLLPIPEAFVPFDHRTVTAFKGIWLVADRRKPPRPFESSLLALEKRAVSDMFTLYRLVPPNGIVFTSPAGGTGGHPFAMVCADNGTIGDFSVVTLPTGLAAVTPLCRNGAGGTRPGRTVGDARKGERTTLACADGAPPFGIVAHADSFMRGIELICPDGSAPSAGRTDPPATRLVCPNGMRLKGMFGSSGSLVDSMGLACGR